MSFGAHALLVTQAPTSIAVRKIYFDWYGVHASIP